MDVKEKAVTEPVEKPAKRPATEWRNWFRSGHTGHRSCKYCGLAPFFAEGDVYGSCCSVYPSKDVAESAVNLLGNDEYLGAFPSSERPPEGRG